MASGEDRFPNLNLSPLLQARLESSQVSDSHLPWETSSSQERESLHGSQAGAVLPSPVPLQRAEGKGAWPGQVPPLPYSAPDPGGLSVSSVPSLSGLASL